MNETRFTRRQWLRSGSAQAAACVAATDFVAAADAKLRAETASRTSGREPFGYCLNTSTIRGANLDLPAQIDVAADAGYAAVELWVGDIEAYVRKGGSIPDLKKRIRDRGLTIPSTISFFPWLADDAAKRERGLEQAKRE